MINGIKIKSPMEGQNADFAKESSKVLIETLTSDCLNGRRFGKLYTSVD